MAEPEEKDVWNEIGRMGSFMDEAHKTGQGQKGRRQMEP